MNQEKYAIIDIGSNTMRLVIYKRDRNGALKEIENKIISCLQDWEPEAYQVEKQKKHLEKQLNCSISVDFS